MPAYMVVEQPQLLDALLNLLDRAAADASAGAHLVQLGWFGHQPLVREAERVARGGWLGEEPSRQGLGIVPAPAGPGQRPGLLGRRERVPFVLG